MSPVNKKKRTPGRGARRDPCVKSAAGYQLRYRLKLSAFVLNVTIDEAAFDHALLADQSDHFLRTGFSDFSRINPR